MPSRLDRNKFDRLTQCNTINDSIDLLEIYADSIFCIMTDNQQTKFKKVYDRDSSTIFQMIFSKILHLRKIINGVNYDGKKNKLRTIIDPTFIAITIRNLIETVSTYHLIFAKPKNEEEQLILYNLWCHAGLEFRSRFDSFITKEENKVKMEDEKKQRKELIEEITSSKLFQSLPEKEKSKIISRIHSKDYKVSIEQNGDNYKVNILSWQQVLHSMSLNDLVDHNYTYFSLYAHPSNVSVFQFANLFSEDGAHLKMTNFNLKNAFIYLSVFLHDYTSYNEKAMESFEKLELVNQALIDFWQATFRNNEFHINDSLKRYYES